MYTGSIGDTSNQEDWIYPFQLTDETNTPVVLTGAAMVVFVTGEDTPHNAIISGSVADGTVVISGDGLTVTWTFGKAKMALLCAGDYAVFVRMTLNGVTTQLISAQLSIVEGGPSS